VVDVEAIGAEEDGRAESVETVRVEVYDFV
jgi:hypothetical protein